MTPAARTLTARTITPAAQAWLEAARPARILGVFERACNLVDDAGAVLSLGGPGVGLAPFGLAVDGEARPFAALTAQSRVRVVDSALEVGPLRIMADVAAVWDPRPDWASLRAALAARPERLDRAAALALAIGKPGSLLEILAFPLSTGCHAEGRSDEASILCSKTLRFAQRDNAPVRGGRAESFHSSPLLSGDERGDRLIRALRSRSLDQALAGARALAGLGGGLTPAGDDFIAGALLAAWAGLFGAGGEALAGPVAAAAAPRTTTLSAAYLRAAAQGECSEHWHAVFAALIADDEAAPEAALRRLLAIGHTSGADALAGFLAARAEVKP